MTIQLLFAAALTLMLIWLLIFQRWQRGIFLLLAFIPFSGIPILLTNYSAPSLLLKDFAFVIPTYIAFYFFTRKRPKMTGVPVLFKVFLFMFTCLVMVQMLNPAVSNLTMALIGAKVWLFYVPLAVLSYHLVKDIESLAKLLRPVVLLSWIPALCGVAQWLACTAFGHKAAMEFLLGDVAYSATHGFTSFQFGATFYRIPSVFSFSAQYSAFLWTALITSYMLSRIDSSSDWRRFSRYTFLAIIIAAFFGGSRSAFFFIPLMAGVIFCYEQGVRGGLKIVGLLALTWLSLAQLGNLDLIAILSNVWTLLFIYGKELGVNELLLAVDMAPLGNGTGSNTVAARYGVESGEAVMVGVENYYGKAVVELGVVGGMIFAAIHLYILAIAIKCRRHLNTPQLRSAAAALTAFFIAMLIGNIKTFRLDFDPINMYYWVFVGMIFRFHSLIPTPRYNPRCVTGRERIVPPMPQGVVPQPAVS